MPDSVGHFSYPEDRKIPRKSYLSEGLIKSFEEYPQFQKSFKQLFSGHVPIYESCTWFTFIRK